MAVTRINWPASLPAIPVTEHGGYTEHLPDNLTISSSVDSGPPLSRPRSSAFYRPITIALIVKTDSQRDAFETFFTDNCAFGTLAFNWRGWVRQGPSVFYFDTTNPPAFEQLGNGVWRITLNLLQFPPGAT